MIEGLKFKVPGTRVRELLQCRLDEWVAEVGRLVDEQDTYIKRCEILKEEGIYEKDRSAKRIRRAELRADTLKEYVLTLDTSETYSLSKEELSALFHSQPDSDYDPFD